MHHCARCGRVKEIYLHCLQETRDLRRHLSTCRHVYLSTRLPVDLSTRLPVYLSTCLPVDLSTRLPFLTFIAFKFKTRGRSVHYCARCGRVKEVCLRCLQKPGIYGDICLPVYLSTCLHVDLSTCLPVYKSTCRLVYPSTCLPVDLSTCRPMYGSLLSSSRQGESGRALLCKMWQGKGDMSVLSTGNLGFKETSVYLFTCQPFYPTTCLPVYCSLLLKHLSLKRVLI